MRVPVAWLREIVELPDVSPVDLAARLTAFDLKLEEIVASGITGPLVVGRVLAMNPEEQKNGKTINWCRVDVGAHNEPSVPDAPGEPVPSRGIVCGAHNFGVGDLVVVSLPGTFLPALGFEIGSRTTYGHVSDGMICSVTELGLSGDDGAGTAPAGAGGILVLPAGSAEPGDDAIAVLGLDDVVLELEVNPDRAYALSLRGVARDAAIAFGVPFDDPADLAPVPAGDGHPVRVDDPAGCPVFTALTVTGFDPTRPSPAWMVRRLEQVGMRSISLAVDVSNYVMLELGQPNHAYDRAKLAGPIVVRRAAAGERLTTLDDVERVLDADDLLIADDAGPIALAGVMGAAHVEIDERTTDIVIEAACFDAPTVFRTGRRHRIASEAGRRNERGIDTTLQARAATRVARLLVEHGGGTVEATMTVVGQATAPSTVTLPVDLPARVTGVDIDATAVVESLRANGCAVELDHDTLSVTAPPWRPDLTEPYDVVEEILRVVGYDQVPSILPHAPAGRGLSKAQRLRRRAGLVLAGAGLAEVKTFPFAGSADFDRLGLDQDDPRRAQVLLENPLSAEEPGLTTTLLTGLLRALELNVGRGHRDVQIVETGRVFVPAGRQAAPIYGVDRRPTADELAELDAALPRQPLHVALALFGDRQRGGWDDAARPASWKDAVSIVRRLADALHVQVEVRQGEHLPWHPGRCAEVLVAGQVVGWAGELHPRVVRAYGLSGIVACAEVDLDALIAAAPDIGPKPSFSTFPVAKEDLALVAPVEVAAETIASALRGADPLVESVRLFDVYTGDQVPAGQRSLAFALRLRAADRTLTDEDIKAARAAAVEAAGTVGATLRT
jgi:phenylalanyl-tRNA synthetase beta chain